MNIAPISDPNTMIPAHAATQNVGRAAISTSERIPPRLSTGSVPSFTCAGTSLIAIGIATSASGLAVTGGQRHPLKRGGIARSQFSFDKEAVTTRSHCSVHHAATVAAVQPFPRKITRVIHSASRLEQTQRFRARDRVGSRCCAQLAVQLAYVGLDGVHRDVQLPGDLAPRKAGCEAPQHGQLGRAGLLDEVTVSGIRSGRGEVLLDLGRDRR
jgi:hypothetical protein